MTLRQRANERRKRMVVHRATSYEDAENWDLMFWQKQGPKARLSALVALHEDLKKIRPGIFDAGKARALREKWENRKRPNKAG